MAITTHAEAVAMRDHARHLFHVIEKLMGELKDDLVALDAYAAPLVDDGSGVVRPMDGTNKPPGG